MNLNILNLGRTPRKREVKNPCNKSELSRFFLVWKNKEPKFFNLSDPHLETLRDWPTKEELRKKLHLMANTYLTDIAT